MDKQRKKLVELINIGRAIGNCNKDECTDCLGEHCSECEAYDIAQTILADGWIRLPCKVGDTAYFTVMFTGSNETLITEEPIIDVSSRGFWTNSSTIPNEELPSFEPWENIGKTAFLSREDAEKALDAKDINVPTKGVE
jgi:hypothetical protein